MQSVGCLVKHVAQHWSMIGMQLLHTPGGCYKIRPKTRVAAVLLCWCQLAAHFRPLHTWYMRLLLQASGSCLKYWPSHCHGRQRYVCGLWQTSAVSLLLSCACLLPACSTACTSCMRLACSESSALRAVINAALGIHLHAGYPAVCCLDKEGQCFRVAGWHTAGKPGSIASHC